jgi:hypothetical protein
MESSTQESDELSQDVLALLRNSIEAYEELEVLLLLHRSRERGWTVAELSERLRLSEDLISAAVARLAAASLAGVAPGGPEGSGPLTARKSYQYRAATPALDATIGELAAAYSDNPVTVIRAMSAHSIQRVRTAALRAFADAFIFKRNKDRG